MIQIYQSVWMIKRNIIQKNLLEVSYWRGKPLCLSHSVEGVLQLYITSAEVESAL